MKLFGSLLIILSTSVLLSGCGRGSASKTSLNTESPSGDVADVDQALLDRIAALEVSLPLSVAKSSLPTTCTAGQKHKYDSVTDAFSCEDIEVPISAVTDLANQLSEKAHILQVPTMVSQLSNDLEFVRLSQVPTCTNSQTIRYNGIMLPLECENITVPTNRVSGLADALDLKADLSIVSDLATTKADAVSVPTALSQLTNDSGYLTGSDSLNGARVTGSIATSGTGANTADFNLGQTISLTPVSSTIALAGLKKGGSYSVIIETPGHNITSVTAPECTSGVRWVDPLPSSAPSGTYGILSILVSDSMRCFFSFRGGL